MFTPVIDVHRSRGAGYCGPTAVAILTGVPLSQIEKLIRRKRKGWGKDINGNNIPIRGTSPWEILYVLKRLGCKVLPVKKLDSTLGQFVRNYEHSGTFLVGVTGHFMVCEKGQVADTTYLTPKPIDQYHRASRRVRQAWKVIAPPNPKYTLEALQQAQERLVASRKERRATKPDVKVVRAQKVAKMVKAWERKEKLAKTKLKKLRSQLKRYARLGVIEVETGR